MNLKLNNEISVVALLPKIKKKTLNYFYNCITGQQNKYCDSTIIFNIFVIWQLGCPFVHLFIFCP